ncbi:MAG TPA: WHG domain-containing protein [Caulobacteraceae bacterium]
MTSRRALEFIGITQPVIIEAAFAIVERVGIEGLNRKILAKEVGLPLGSLEKYFKHFDELQDELTVRALEELVEAHRGISQKRVGREALDAFALAERGFGLARPKLYPVALRPARRVEFELDRLRGIHTNTAAAMVAGYGVPANLVREVAHCLSMALQGFINAEINGIGITRPEFDQSYERLLDILDAGARSAAERACRRCESQRFQRSR